MSVIEAILILANAAEGLAFQIRATILIAVKMCLSCFAPVSLLISLCSSVYGQGTIQVTFDQPTPQPPGTAIVIQQYQEAGVLFVPIQTVGFVRRGGDRDIFAENGTTYLPAGFGSTLQFNFTNASLFHLVSMDLAEFSITVTNMPVTFAGYREDGSIVTTIFTPDGIIDGTGPITDFETFYFGPEFSNLTRVEIPTYGWSMDNLVITIVPEPTTTSLFLLGGLFLLKRKCSSPV